jgi:hypothetical protein
MRTETTMTKIEMRALCDAAVRDNPNLIRRFPMHVRGSSARGAALLRRDPRAPARPDSAADRDRSVRSPKPRREPTVYDTNELNARNLYDSAVRTFIDGDARRLRTALKRRRGAGRRRSPRAYPTRSAGPERPGTSKPRACDSSAPR